MRRSGDCRPVSALSKIERALQDRRAWWESPAATEQRTASRFAFHDLSAAASRTLIAHDYASLLRGANPARGLARAGHLVRYIGTSHALVRTGTNRTKIVSSTVPFIAASGRGPKRAVDLTLRRHRGEFVAANPLEPVSISQRSAGGVSVGLNAIKLLPQGRAVAGTPLGDAVFFHGVGPDEDATVTPTIRGAELSTVLRSKLSPEQIAYRMTLPPGARLVERAGGATVERRGQVLASIPAPSAVDAQHTPVPVSMHVRGDELTLNVPHRSLSVAYPAMVDPKIYTFNVNRTTPYWSFSAATDGGPHEIEGPEAGVLTAPTVRWGTEEIPDSAENLERYCEERKAVEHGLILCYSIYEEPRAHARSTWNWEPPYASTVTNATYEGVSISPVVENSHEIVATGGMNYRVGCREGVNEVTSVPPSTFSCGSAPTMSLEVNQPPTEEVNWGGLFSTEVVKTSVPTTLAIEAVTITQERTRHRRRGPRKSELLGPRNEVEPDRTRSCEGDPVDCATGNLTETQNDLNIPGRGIGLDLTRTYNAQAASSEERHGHFGYGWSWSFGAAVERVTHTVEGVKTETQTVHQANGSTAVYREGRSSAPGVQATLERSGGNYLFKLPSQTLLTFDGSGQLTRETDRNGNVTVVEEICEGGEDGGGVAEVRMRYADYTTGRYREDVSGGSERACRIEVTDPAGRKLTLYLNAEGLVERATDPTGHTITYGYEGGNLTSVTYPGESSPRWRFHYDSQHRMTEAIDGKGHATKNIYDAEGRVSEQTDRRGDTRHFAYEETGSPIEGAGSAGAETQEEEELPELTEAEETALHAMLGSGEETPPAPLGSTTTITDQASGEVTKEQFGPEAEPSSITRGYGTAAASTETFEYDEAGAPTSITDGNGHTTKYTYDESGNRTSQTDADGDETKWEYDAKHDVVGTTNPNGEHTRIERDSHGNALKVLRPAPGGPQSTEYAYNGYGELTAMTDPLEHVWKYEYDADGDRTAEIDPEGDKRTFTFNPDSQETSTTSPRGNVSGANPGQYTTIIERDEQGRVIRVIEPLQ